MHVAVQVNAFVHSGTKKFLEKATYNLFDFQVKKPEKKRQWSLTSIFQVCLLACTITTASGVLILFLVYVNNSQPHSEPGAQPLQTAIPMVQKAVDPKFKFLNHLPKSKAVVASRSSGDGLHADDLLMAFQVFEFPGGAIQWAWYRNNVKDYLSIEEEAFGSSLNSQRSQMTLGTLRIKSNGLRTRLSCTGITSLPTFCS
ncbi:hypothetical protein J1605_022201 [Eschrichtius robustus]|uniref:CLLAC-motif containing domain-containing protein n=1 Tax=Eschrichtius robustus TaxID=9764 RepID=A0AB34H8X1_ESCRO|nr:hypothetical protein J1605_022201 [Eschrichtius robustus]